MPPNLPSSYMDRGEVEGGGIKRGDAAATTTAIMAAAPSGRRSPIRDVSPSRRCPADEGVAGGRAAADDSSADVVAGLHPPPPPPPLARSSSSRLSARRLAIQRRRLAALREHGSARAAAMFEGAMDKVGDEAAEEEARQDGGGGARYHDAAAGASSEAGLWDVGATRADPASSAAAAAAASINVPPPQPADAGEERGGSSADVDPAPSPRSVRSLVRDTTGMIDDNEKKAEQEEQEHQPAVRSSVAPSVAEDDAVAGSSSSRAVLAAVATVAAVVAEGTPEATEQDRDDGPAGAAVGPDDELDLPNSPRSSSPFEGGRETSVTFAGPDEARDSVDGTENESGRDEGGACPTMSMPLAVAREGGAAAPSRELGEDTKKVKSELSRPELGTRCGSSTAVVSAIISAMPVAADSNRGSGDCVGQVASQVVVMVTNSSSEDIMTRFDIDPIDIGCGQYGIVRACRDRRTGETLAVKSIPKSTEDEGKGKGKKPSKLTSIQREVDILKDVQGHPHIVRLVGSYEDLEYVHLVTEMCPRGMLFDRIVRGRKDRPVTDGEASNLVKNILDAVTYLHDEKDVVHRDIKPENFLYAATDTAAAASAAAIGDIDSSCSSIKLIDFGMARYHRPDSDPPMKTSLGTAYYTAPEVLCGRAGYGRSCDVWSVGVVSYMILSGYYPFYGDGTTAKIIEHVKSGDYDFPLGEWDGVPALAKDFVRCLLRADPAERPTAAEAREHPWIVGGGAGEGTSMTVVMTKKKKKKKKKRLSSRIGLRSLKRSLSLSGRAGSRKTEASHDDVVPSSSKEEKEESELVDESTDTQSTSSSTVEPEEEEEAPAPDKSANRRLTPAPAVFKNNAAAALIELDEDETINVEQLQVEQQKRTAEAMQEFERHQRDPSDSSSSINPLRPILKPASSITAEAANEARTKKSISFSDVELREHERILGDHTHLFGPPLGIGWAYNVALQVPVEDFESNRPPKQTKKLQPLDTSCRYQAMIGYGYSLKELKRAVTDRRSGRIETKATRRTSWSIETARIKSRLSLLRSSRKK